MVSLNKKDIKSSVIMYIFTQPFRHGQHLIPRQGSENGFIKEFSFS